MSFNSFKSLRVLFLLFFKLKNIKILGKRWFIFSFTVHLFVLSILSSCGIDIGETKKQNNKFSISSCFKGMSKQASNYFTGKMDENQSELYFSCLIKGIRDFRDYVKLKKMNAVEAKDLNIFLNKSFGAPLMSDSFLKALMALKQDIIRTSGKKIFQTDLDLLIDFLERVKPVFVKLSPSMPYLSFQETFLKENSNHEKEIELTTKNLKVLIEQLNPFFVKHKSIIRLDILKQVIALGLNYLNWKPEKIKKLRLDQWFETIKISKKSIFQTDYNSLSFKEWKSASLLAADWHHFGMKFFFLGRNLSLFDSETDLNKAFNLINELLYKSQLTLTYTKSGQLARVDIATILNALSKTQVSPKIIRKKSLTRFLTPIIGRGLGYNRKTYSFLTKSKLEVAAKKVNQWYRSLLSIDYVFNGGSCHSKNTKKNVQDCNYNELVDLYNAVKVKFDKKTKKIIIDRDYLKYNSASDFSYSLKMLTTIRSIALLLIESFNPEAKRILGLTEEQMKTLIESIEGIGEDLYVLSPLVIEPWKSFFFEANHFTSIGDGAYIKTPDNSVSEIKKYLTINEMINYVSMIMTAVRSSDSLYFQHKPMLKEAPNVKFFKTQYRPIISSEKDEFGRYTFKEKEFLKIFKKDLLQSLSHMSELQKYLSDLNDEDWSTFIDILVSVSHTPCDTDSIVTSTQITKMVASLHYLETLFLQYDRNQGSEGFIVFEEAERAYGRFANFLKLMIHKDTIKNTTFGFLAGDTVNVKDNIAKYTFYYLLTKGQLPESSWSTKSDFLFKKLWGWDFQLDRLQLFQVFKVISEQVKLENKEKEEQLCSP